MVTAIRRDRRRRCRRRRILHGDRIRRRAIV